MPTITPRPSFIQRVCWLFAGSEMHLLRDCPTDFNRQASIGFTIFMTCLFGALSGGYAAWRFTASADTNEGSWGAAIGFGLVWGLLIFSIDRSMVVTLKKDPTQKKQSFWIPLFSRALLASLLAFLISIPVEVKFFEKEIAVQFDKDAENAIKSQRETITGNSGLSTYLREEEQQRQDEALAQKNADADESDVPGWKTIHEQVVNAANRAQVAEREASNQQARVNNLAGRAFRPAYFNDVTQSWVPRRRGPTWNAWTEARRRAAAARKAGTAARSEQTNFVNQAALVVSGYRASNQQKVNKARGAREIAEAVQDSITTRVIGPKTQKFEEKAKSPSFLRQFVALGHAAKLDPDVWLPLWLIRLIFFTIELLPTLVKLITPIGEYDWKLYGHEKEFELRLKTNLQILNDQEKQRQASDSAIATHYEATRQREESRLNESVLRETADRQNALALAKLDEWYDQASASGPSSSSENDGSAFHQKQSYASNGHNHAV